MFWKRLILAASTVMLAAGSVTVAGMGTASACIADADGDCYLHVTGTVTSANLNVRAAPWGTVLDNVPNGYSNTVDCYVQASDGSYWDWLYDSRIGRSGWVYDPYLYTGGNIYQQVDQMSEGNCGSIPLTMPSNVTATATSTGSIRVSWGDTNGGAAQYVVSNGNVSSATLPAGTTSYTWSGLAPNTYMCFTVAAKESGQQSPWTAYACTYSWTLKAPSSESATVTSTTSIRVTWNDPNGGAAQYVVSNGNVSSATLPAGTTSYTWTGLNPGTYMCFTIAAKQSGQQSAWSSYACTTTPVYVNMGDSFSAGEGTYGPYQSGTDTSTDMCHRSSNSFSGQYAASSSYWNTVTNIACSGATTPDIVTAPGAKNAMGIPTQGEPAQVSALSSKTSLVTMTIGGNDLNLAGLIGNCLIQGARDSTATNNCYHNAFSDSFINSISNLVPALESTYQAIQQAAPNARLIVSTYPDTFPQTYTGQCSEGIGPVQIIYLITSQDELTRINEVVTALNSAITTAANAVGAEVMNVQGLFSGHEMCTGSPWVNQVTGINWVSGTYQDESLHPNTTGYQHWAAALKQYIGY